MILKRLSLKNFRSYVDETIVFPEGTLLLSGDVGSGKTSILLAIEFALFGVLKGEVSASSLLRHGCNEGIVELAFSIDDVNYSISRSLKRSRASIKQGAGTFGVNGNIELLTPVELKARILAVLGYPENLLSKSKSIIFRYTVYTPQEEMKRIILDNVELRLSVLRKLFGIDSYKLVAENSSLMSRDLNSEVRMISSSVETIHGKKAELESLDDEIESLKRNMVSKTSEMDDVDKTLKVAEEKLSALKSKAEKVAFIRNSISNLSVRLESSLNNISRIEKNISSFESRLRKDLPEKVDESLIIKHEDHVKKAREVLASLNDKLSSATSKKFKVAADIEQTNRAIDRLNKLSASCPTCQQNIPDEHKEGLLSEQKRISDKLSARSSELEGFIAKVKEKISSAQNIIDDYSAKVQELKISKARYDQASSEKKSIENNIKRLSSQKLSEEKTVAELKKSLLEQKAELKILEDVSEQFLQAEKDVKKIVSEKQSLSIALARLEERSKHTAQNRDKLLKEISELKLLRKRLELLQKTSSWLKESFLPAVSSIERAVFSSVHEEFSSLFSEWFSQIIDDDTISVSLDNDFTPIIEQNGYESEVLSLSGGEKTAVALAYRLALHHVVNEFIGTINTRDILILDEPTDGFSEYQLDQLKELLSNINVEQIILVSHESKLESFVDHTIRIEKQDQVSRILL